MHKIIKVLRESLESSRKIRYLLLIITGIYIVSFLVGYQMVLSQIPFVLNLSEIITENLSTNPIFNPIIGALTSGNLALAIAYTFIVNLSSGAFASTTLPGIIPFLGALGLGVITGLRGFLIGVLFSYNNVFGISTGYTIVVIGTLILELGAYVFSAAAGINISLSTIFPSRYQVDSRWSAFKLAWKDAGRIYIIVIILLALGAIWEMSGIFISMP